MPAPSQQTPGSPLPNLQVQPGSGLDFPWAEYQRGIVSTAEAVMASDGVTCGMVILMNWQDVVGPKSPPHPLGQLLGYSSRLPAVGLSGLPGIHRELPWQHPIWTQLFVKRIAGVRGIQQGEKIRLVKVGAFEGTNAPFIDFKLGMLTLEFWRPPYYIRTDEDALMDDASGVYPHEWIRYLDRHWEISTQILTRAGQTFRWRLSGNSSSQPVVPPGQPLCKLMLKRRWYEVPEECLFKKLSDGTPTGIPTNLLYTQTDQINPITNGIGGGGTNQYTYKAGRPFPGTVNAPTDGTLVDNGGSNRFLGFPMGTLLYLGVELIPRPLQLPPEVMEIMRLGNSLEPLTQIQYDVVFNFSYFDPPVSETPGPVETFRGHNLMPYTGTGLWQSVITQQDTSNRAYVDNATNGPFMTLVHFTDFTDLFSTL